MIFWDFFGGNLCKSKEPCDQSAGDQQAMLNPSPLVALQIPEKLQTYGPLPFLWKLMGVEVH